MSLPRRSKDTILTGSTTLPELANINTNQSNNSITSTNMAALSNTTHLENKQSNASSGFDEDDNTSIESKSGVLPPIDSNTKVLGPRKSIELSRQEKSLELCSPKPKTAIGGNRITSVDKKPCDIDKPKPNSLPPITSTDGIPGFIDIKLQKSIVIKNADKHGNKRSPRKRAKTHVIYKELNRGDSWELLKAEKIRCVELSKYEEKLEAERQQKNVKKYKKKNNEKKNSSKKLSSDKKRSSVKSLLTDDDDEEVLGKGASKDHKDIKISKKKSSRPVGRRNKNRKTIQSEESDD